MTESLTERAIDAATRRNGRLFIAYIIVLLVTAVIIAIFTWLNWDSGNKLQDAIRADATARIAEATRDIPNLQRAASDAKAAQQRVELDLAKQQEKTAKAEQALLEIQERMKDRHLSIEQQQNIIAKLRPFAGMRLNLFAISNGGDEVVNFGKDILKVLNGPGSAEWVVSRSLADEPGLVVPGIGIEMQRNADQRSIEAANALLKALAAERLSVGFIAALPVGESRMKAGQLNEDPKAMIRLIIGKKP